MESHHGLILVKYAPIGGSEKFGKEQQDKTTPILAGSYTRKMSNKTG